MVTECKEKVKSMRRWSGLQRVGKCNVKGRSLESQEEVKGMRMLGEGKRVESSNVPCYIDKFFWWVKQGRICFTFSAYHFLLCNFPLRTGIHMR